MPFFPEVLLFFDLTLLVSLAAKKSRLRDARGRHAFKGIAQRSIITRTILTLNELKFTFTLNQMSFTCQYRRFSLGKFRKKPFSILIVVLTIDL